MLDNWFLDNWSAASSARGCIELPSMIPQGVFLPRTLLPFTWYSLSLPTTAKGMLSCWTGTETQTRHTCTVIFLWPEGPRAEYLALKHTFLRLIQWYYWRQEQGSLRRTLDWQSEVLGPSLNVPLRGWLTSVSQLSFNWRSLCTFHTVSALCLIWNNSCELAKTDRTSCDRTRSLSVLQCLPWNLLADARSWMLIALGPSAPPSGVCVTKCRCSSPNVFPLVYLLLLLGKFISQMLHNDRNQFQEMCHWVIVPTLQRVLRQANWTGALSYVVLHWPNVFMQHMTIVQAEDICI